VSPPVIKTTELLLMEPFLQDMAPPTNKPAWERSNALAFDYFDPKSCVARLKKTL
jgi:hypothetical protein